MNSLTWKPITHNNPYTLKADEGLIFMPEPDRAVISLPPNANPGTLVGIIDAGSTFDSQPLTINPNGNRIDNTATDAYIFNAPGSVVQLLYTGPVFGWKLLSAPQPNPFARSINFAISDFIVDSITLNKDYLIWLLNPPNISKHVQLPPLSGNKGLYYMLVDISMAEITVRPHPGDLIMGAPDDYVIPGRSAIHIAASDDSNILGWVLTAKNSS